MYTSVVYWLLVTSVLPGVIKKTPHVNPQPATNYQGNGKPTFPIAKNPIRRKLKTYKEMPTDLARNF